MTADLFIRFVGFVFIRFAFVRNLNHRAFLIGIFILVFYSFVLPIAFNDG